MFHYASAIVWGLLQPVNLIGLLLAASILAGLLRWRKTALSASSAALLVLALGGWTSLGALLMQPLEDRFVRPDPAPDRIDGIIVLGGGFEGAINLARGGHELNRGGDRFVETAILARRYPEARIVISGGSGSVMLAGEGDADTAPRLLEALGVDRARLELENQSRDTYENSVMTRRLIEPKPGERWLLVTSAFHMPRSVALFRKAGFDVIPWPSDYRTTGQETFGLARDNVIDNLHNLTTALREWIGLSAYWLTGRTDTLLPEAAQE